MNKTNTYIGQSLGRYKFVELIGQGAIGAVYEAFDQQLFRPVAIKVSLPQVGKETVLSNRMMREAQIIARIEHANIIPIYDVINHEDSIFIIMRMLNGKNLGQLMHGWGKPINVNEAFKIMHQVMLGIEFAHSKGVVHSDLKPANIFISDSNEIFTLDFGLAALLELEKLDKDKIYGTPLYMSPEQCKGLYPDARSDIYSLGLILYKLIVGHHPFAKIRSVQQLLSLQIEKVPVRPDKANTEVSEELSDCLMKALEKDPQKRYRSCSDFLQKIEESLPNFIKKEPKPKNLRWNPRAKLSLQAQLQLQNTKEIIAAKITDLSVGGANIIVPASLGPGTKLTIEFDILEGDNYVTISTPATILWKDTRHDDYMLDAGISFDGLSSMDKQYLGFFIRNLLLDIN